MRNKRNINLSISKEMKSRLKKCVSICERMKKDISRLSELGIGAKVELNSKKLSRALSADVSQNLTLSF